MNTCCNRMSDMLVHSCSEHDRYECPDQLLDQHDDGVIGILVKDGGDSMIEISFCPWCGTNLPKKTD